MNTIFAFLLVIPLSLTLASCGLGGESDDAFGLHYQSSKYFVDFLDPSHEGAKKIVFRIHETQESESVFVMRNKTRSGFAYDTTTTSVAGKFIKRSVDKGIGFCKEEQIYDLEITYAEGATSLTLKGSRVPCTG